MVLVGQENPSPGTHSLIPAGEGVIVLCVASSGIAAVIIGGTTTHNMFKIPIHLHEQSLCSMKRGLDRAQLFQKTSLIIWDEVPMQHCHMIEAVDRTCRDMLQCSHLPFGGITVAFRGDFQQILPVLPKGNKEEIIGACIQRSPLWYHVNILHLTKNMCVDPEDPHSTWFENWLSHVGQGNNLPVNHSLTIPQHMICQPEVSSLISLTYPTLQHGLEMSDQFFLERTILCPRNTEVDDINCSALNVFPGEERLYSSADSIKEVEGADHVYPLEYLNSITIPGLPPSQLRVKLGVPLMLLHNVDVGRGL